MAAAASAWAGRSRARGNLHQGPTVTAVLSTSQNKHESHDISGSFRKKGTTEGRSFRKAVAVQRSDSSHSILVDQLLRGSNAHPHGPGDDPPIAAGAVPGSQADLVREQMDVFQATRVISQVSELVGPELTRQNTGTVAAPLFDALQNERRKQPKTRSGVLVDPRTSKYFPLWDALVSVAIVFTAIVTPYEVSFLPAATSAANGLFLVNRCIDILFVIDLAVNFVLMFPEGEEGDSGILWVEDHGRIAQHYLRGWFTLDLASLAPSLLDIYSVAVGSSGGDLNGVRALRALRALRLIKMVRIVKTAAAFKRMESKLAIDYTALELLKCLMAVVFCTHWMACIWVIQASLVSPTILDSWLGTYAYCEARTVDVDGTYSPCPTDRVCRLDTPGASCEHHGSIYAASIYWAIATIVSVGYGDIGATPHNAAEQVVCAALILAGGILWGWVVGTFCGTIANLAPGTRAFRDNMNDLNHYLSVNRVDKELRQRLREYFHRSRHINDASNQFRLLNQMSPMLQSEVVLAVNARWVQQIWFLANAEAEFVVRLTLLLGPMVLAPFELAPTGFLYVLYRGVVILGGEVVTKGNTWGEDIILAEISPGLCRNLNAKALNYVEVYVCTHETLMSALIGFPTSAAHLRRCALRLAFRRNLLLAAEDVRRARKRAAAIRENSEVDDNPMQRSATRKQLSGSFKRGKSIHNMFARSTVTTDAQSALQKQLISMRSSQSISASHTDGGQEEGGEEDGSNAGTSSRRSVLEQPMPSAKVSFATAKASSSDEGASHSLHDIARAVMQITSSIEAIGADVSVLKKQASDSADLVA